ncbi:MAG: hypothetical protein V1928_02895 [Parcubacteria group bacterium]
MAHLQFILKITGGACMKGFRKIIVNGKLWWWKIGKTYVTARLDGTNIKKVINLCDLTGISWEEIERSKNRHYFSVTPKQIETWLKGVKIDEPAK